MSRELVDDVLQQLAYGSPVYLVWLVGIVLALRHRTEAPARSSLVLRALALFLVLGMVGAVASVLPLLMRVWDTGTTAQGLILFAVSLGFSVAAALGWRMVLTALFRHPLPNQETVSAPLPDARPEL